MQSPSHVVSGAPEGFSQKAQALIDSNPTALELCSVTLTGGVLAAIFGEWPRAARVSGSLIGIRVGEAIKEPSVWFGSLLADNPYWALVAAFAGKSGVTLVAVLRQP